MVYETIQALLITKREFDYMIGINNVSHVVLVMDTSYDSSSYRVLQNMQEEEPERLEFSLRAHLVASSRKVPRGR